MYRLLLCLMIISIGTTHAFIIKNYENRSDADIAVVSFFGEKPARSFTIGTLMISTGSRPTSVLAENAVIVPAGTTTDHQIPLEEGTTNLVLTKKGITLLQDTGDVDTLIIREDGTVWKS